MTTAAGAEQLRWEAGAGRLAAAAAFAAGLLPIIGGVVFASGFGAPSEGSADFLTAVDDAATSVRLGAVISAIGTLLLPLPLAYLYAALRARRPGAPRFIPALLAVAAVGLAATFVIQQFMLTDVASDFAAAGATTDDAADDLLQAEGLGTVEFVRLGFTLALAVCIIIVSLNAMRAGLLGRFMGIVGVLVGALYAVPIIPLLPLLFQLFWLIALGFLFLDRWPGGERGPAWSRVEAIPWPSAAEQREAVIRRREQEDQTRQVEPSGSDGAEAAGSAPPKRKRKRRR